MARKGLCIPSKITWAVLLSTFASTLAALVMHQRRAGIDAEAHHRRRVTGWADLGARQVGEAADAPDDPVNAARLRKGDPARAIEQFQRWSWSVLQDREIFAALLVAHDGEVLARAPESAGVRGLDPALRAETPWSRHSLRIGGTERQVCVAVSSIRRGRNHGPIGKIVLLASPESQPIDARSTLSFVGPVLCVSILAVALTSMWVRSTLGRSLEVMAREEDCQGPGWLGKLPVHRDDELGAIARSLQRFADRAVRAGVRADALQKNVHARVADKTKRIEVMLQQAQKTAWLDSLTKLYNRRFLDEKLQQLFDEQRAASEDMTLIMFDIDHFKVVNDTLGHSAGDDLLSFAGELLRGSLRGTDICVRYGGDEFVVIMLESSQPEGSALAQRVVRLFTQQAALINIAPALSMSAGVASLLADRPDNSEHLLQLADEALYRAKRSGKNAVETVGAARRAQMLDH